MNHLRFYCSDPQTTRTTVIIALMLLLVCASSAPASQSSPVAICTRKGGVATVSLELCVLTWQSSLRSSASIAWERSSPSPSPTLAISTRRRPVGSVPLDLLGLLKPTCAPASSWYGSEPVFVPPCQLIQPTMKRGFRQRCWGIRCTRDSQTGFELTRSSSRRKITLPPRQ